MRTIKGPAIFLAQFMGDSAPFNNLENVCKWVASLGYKGVQIPSWDKRCIDLQKAAESRTYADEVKGIVEGAGLQITELTSHLQGQLMAVHPGFDSAYNAFAPKEAYDNPRAKQEWAATQLTLAAKASVNLGLYVHATFSGSLLWHTFYPWPPRTQADVERGFKELATRWLPVLKTFDEAGVDLCYEIHPGEDLHDGVTFERFLKATGNHPRVNILYDPSHFVLQQLDYLQYIDFYHPFIKAFHVKDAEFRSNGKSGVYGGYQEWIDRPGRFRSTGDGQVDFKAVFSKLTQFDYPGWAVLEWECCIKSAEAGAREGADLIRSYIIPVSDRAFDDFAAG